MKKLLPLLLLPFALLLIPPTAHAACTTPELPVVGCPVPGATETPTPSPGESPTPEPTPSFEPGPNDGPTGFPMPSQPPAQTPFPAVIDGGPLLPPSAVTTTPPVPIVMAGGQTTTAPAAVVTTPLSGVLASSFAIVVFGLLALPLLLSFLAGLRPAGSAPSPGGNAMRDRTRLWTGLGVLAAAAIVGGVGWYRVSGEPLLNRQIPFLASAGILVVILSVLGGSLIIAEQLRGDQNRIGDLEEAVRVLTEALAPSIEQPARVEAPATEVLTPGRGRSRRAGAGST